MADKPLSDKAKEAPPPAGGKSQSPGVGAPPANQADKPAPVGTTGTPAQPPLWPAQPEAKPAEGPVRGDARGEVTEGQPAHLSPGRGPGVHGSEGTPAATDVKSDAWPSPDGPRFGPAADPEGQNLRCLHDIPPFKKGDVIPRHALPHGCERHIEIGAVEPTNADCTVKVPELPPALFANPGARKLFGDAGRMEDGYRSQLADLSNANAALQSRCTELERKLADARAGEEKAKAEAADHKRLADEARRVNEAQPQTRTVAK